MARFECVLPSELKAQVQVLAIEKRTTASEIVRRGLVTAVATRHIGGSAATVDFLLATRDAQWDAYERGVGPDPRGLRADGTPRTV